MTIRYLAKHTTRAQSAAKSVGKPGEGSRAPAPLKGGKGCAPPTTGKVICKRPKKKKCATETGSRRDFKSS